MFLLARNLIRSRAGRAVIAIRDNQTSAAVSGINVPVYKTLIFGISAATAGIAGSMFMMLEPFATDTRFNVNLAIFLVVGLVAGVRPRCRRVPGAWLIVFIPWYTSEWSSDPEGMPPGLRQLARPMFEWLEGRPGAGQIAGIFFGILLIVLVFVLPGGIVNGLRQLRARIITGRAEALVARRCQAAGAARGGHARRRRRRRRPDRQLEHHQLKNQGRQSMGSTRRLTAIAACVWARPRRRCGDDDDADDTPAASDAPGATEGDAAPTTAAGADETTGGADTTAAGTDETTGGADTTAAETDETTDETTASGGGAAGGDASGFGTATASGEGPYGQSPDDENIYVGAGDFELDLAECPSDYDPLQGITDDEIKLAISLPKSGAFAGFGLLADGMTSYFNYVNETYGGIDGRQITLDVKDDNYEPSRDEVQRRRDAAVGRVRRVHGGAGHGQQPRDLGRPQRGVHAAAAQRHGRRPVG